jgi:CRISPR-associated endonuclease/helicase Cas3
MSLAPDDFTAFHLAVHGRVPFAWQSRLLQQVVKNRAWPEVLDLPTGSGKTTCIDIALFALALDAQNPKQRWCPRRIAMVVDRRVVVDQVAERGRKLGRALRNPKASEIVTQVSALLRSLSRDGRSASESADPVGVFTLRGGMPKDDSWARTPDQPLILASTVDQIGSRLLIQGYGVSQGMKPVHAGLLGNDLLLLLDEVHLSQPFAETIESLRGLRHKFTKVTPRFCSAFLSATPGKSAADTFALLEEEKNVDSPLGPRLHVKKAAHLREATGRQAVEEACVQEALKLSAKHEVIAVIANRVASAASIAKALHESLKDACDVKLMTGRMRPLERDQLVDELRPRVGTGRTRPAGRRLIVVGTQCIEAGADFDFDALVTEAASLDALRQRFGRVDRLGEYEESESAIVIDKSVKDDDPIYGEALFKTTRWLKSIKKVDFGVLALPVPEGEALQELLGPKPGAPVLLPAYFDLWMQTSPAPARVPDIGLWLHGPSSGPADVQVIWRIDFSEDDLKRANVDPAAANQLAAIVAAVRPSSLEAISIPYLAAQRWLSKAPVEDFSDAEGARQVDNAERQSAQDTGAPRLIRLALRWNGEESEVISASGLRPGDTIIVPAMRGGIRDFCFDDAATVPVSDLAEQAALFARGQPTLRMRPEVLAQLRLPPMAEDVEEIRNELQSQTGQADSKSWRAMWLAALAQGKESFPVGSVDGEDTWLVLRGKRIPAKRLLNLNDATTVEDGVELTTDEDDSFHAGQPVSLATHSCDVERFARDYSEAAGLSTELIEDIALAGWLHDIGKADRRFQILLRGGSEIDFLKDETPLAKSGMPPGAKAAHRRAQIKSGYPQGTRHEVLSVAMLEQRREHLEKTAKDLDLVLHLVASHHGYCRPFAPVSLDESPVDVSLTGHQSDVFKPIDFGPLSSKHELHRIDAPLADRFWGLVDKYGWLELCWFEAILRLADHRASEMEQEAMQ